MTTIFKLVTKLLLLRICFLERFNLPENYKLETKSFIFEENKFCLNGINIQFGSGNEDTKNQLLFIPDLTFGSLIAGQKSTSGWGIECSSDISCQIDSTEYREFFFASMQTFTQKSSAFLTFDEKMKLSKNNENSKRISFEYIVAGNSRGFMNSGVVGLSPKSTFFAYLKNQFLGNNKIALVYKNQAIESDLLQYQFHSFLNPTFPAEDVVVSIPIEKSAENWNFKANVDFFDEILEKKNIELCVNLVSNDIIQVADPILLCNLVKKMVCGTVDVDKCQKRDIDYGKAPIIKIQVGEAIFSFLGEEYLYFVKNKLRCAFGTISDLKSKDICPIQSELGLGKGFFSKFPAVLDFSPEEEKSKLIFLKKFEYKIPEESKRWFYFYVAIFVVICGAIGAFFMQKQYQGFKEEDTPKYQNV